MKPYHAKYFKSLQEYEAYSSCVKNIQIGDMVAIDPIRSSLSKGLQINQFVKVISIYNQHYTGIPQLKVFSLINPLSGWWHSSRLSSGPGYHTWLTFPSIILARILKSSSHVSQNQ